MNEDYADEIEKREKAGVDAPVEGMLSKRDRELWRKAVARGSFCEDVRTNANIVYLIDSHDACERALREAQAQNDELFGSNLQLGVMVDGLESAQERNQLLERLLGEAVKAVMHVSGPSHPLALEIREALAPQPPQAGGEEKPHQ